MEAAQRSNLFAVKLEALARANVVDEQFAIDRPGEFGGGAALMVVHECGARSAWVLLDQPGGKGLGAAIAWAQRFEAAVLHVVLERADGAGVVARRSFGFRLPVHVWRADGRTLHPVPPDDLPDVSMMPLAQLEFTATIVAGGAVPVIEHGVLAGEVNGLEVCRVVVDPDTGEVRLDVGIGAHDRETFQMLHGAKPKVEALAEVVRSVAEHRRHGAPRHPLNLLAQERLLRSRLVADPSLIGATAVAITEPPVPRSNLKDAVPCVAVADMGGRRVAVVCSVGVDLDVVPFAIDVCAAVEADEALVAVPGRDLLDVQRRIAALAGPSITFVPVD